MAKRMNKSRELGEEKIGKLLWKYFLPSFIGMTANSLYNIVDRIFIGRGVGTLELSGVSLVFPVMMIVFAVGLLFGIGTGVLVSINMGRRDMGSAEKVLGTGTLLIVLVALLTTAFGYLIKTPLLESFGANSETIGFAQEYLDIILAGTILQMLGMGLNIVIRSEGNANIAMYSMLISAGLNILLDPIFIFWFDMGISGAAIATLISQSVLLIWVLAHFRSKRSVVHLKPANLRFNPEFARKILAIGMAPFAMHILGSLIMAVLNSQLIKYGGDIAVGAMGIIQSIAMMIIMSIISLNMASQPIIGFNHGAGLVSRVKETLVLGMKAATVISIGTFLIVQLFPESIISLFSSGDQKLLDIGSRGIRMYLLLLPLIGFQIVVSNYFQSIGNAKIAMILTLMRQAIILLPALFILPFFYGLDGIWLAAPISDFASSIVVVWFLVREWKVLNIEDKLPEELDPVPVKIR